MAPASIAPTAVRRTKITAFNGGTSAARQNDAIRNDPAVIGDMRPIGIPFTDAFVSASHWVHCRFKPARSRSRTSNPTAATMAATATVKYRNPVRAGPDGISGQSRTQNDENRCRAGCHRQGLAESRRQAWGHGPAPKKIQTDAAGDHRASKRQPSRDAMMRGRWRSAERVYRHLRPSPGRGQVARAGARFPGEPSGGLMRCIIRMRMQFARYHQRARGNVT